MPTYQYACTSCGQHREVVQRMTDDPLTTCEACDGALRKVLFPVGVVFKGAGFYRTDSRSTSTNGSSKADDNGSGEKSDAKTSDANGSDGASSKDGAGSSDGSSGSATSSGSSESSGSAGSSGSSKSGKSTKPSAPAGASTS